MKKVTVEAIFELPFRAFKKTEAKTHILIIRKSCPSPIHSYSIKVNKVNDCGEIDGCITVPSDALVKRMDYS
ncbi:hypothetical protein ACWKSR_11730, partial [Campylobacter fetus subsp. venerealis]